MRVFTFLLMMAVAVGGGLAGYRMITGKDLVKLEELGGSLLSAAATVTSTPLPTTPPTPRPEPTPEPTQTPPPATSTPKPPEPEGMVVGNTEGLGVYMRRTPHLDDRLRAYHDGTPMEILGPPTQADGKTWRHVRAPDGAEGYVPEEYLVP